MSENVLSRTDADGKGGKDWVCSIRFHIYLILEPDGRVTPMARDIYSEIFRGETFRSVSEAKFAAKLWAIDFFKGRFKLTFSTCTRIQADKWKEAA